RVLREELPVLRDIPRYPAPSPPGRCPRHERTPISSQRRNSTPPPLSLQSVILLLYDRARWLIIEALANGEPRMINELAKHVGKSPAATSKHVGLLRQFG